MQSRYLLPGLLFFVGIWLSFPSCKHDPIFEEMDVNPMDTTTNPVDTMPVDTMNNGTPCDPDVVYFDQDILPILISNCALSGCHNEASAQDGVVLTSFEKVMQTGKIEPFDLNDSEVYEVLTENDPDKRMPPPPTAPLNQELINVIAKWILQGAQDLECDPNAGGCDTDNVSFAGFVKPTIQTHCQGCHSGAVPSGGIDLTNYNNIKMQATNGKLYGVISWSNGFSNMPQGGNKLPDCTIDKIKSWVDAGAPNN